MGLIKKWWVTDAATEMEEQRENIEIICILLFPVLKQVDWIALVAKRKFFK